MNGGTVTPSRIASEAHANLAAQLLFLVFMGGLVAVSRRYFDLHLGIPGHTGLLWIFLMVTGRAVAKRDGAGVVMGASAALWGAGIGLNHSLHYNLALYSLTGLGLDLAARAFRTDLRHPLLALAAGAMAHAVKFLFILGYAVGLGLPKNIFIIGVATSFGYHLLFGALGGLLAGLTLWLVSRRNLLPHLRTRG